MTANIQNKSPKTRILTEQEKWQLSEMKRYGKMIHNATKWRLDMEIKYKIIGDPYGLHTPHPIVRYHLRTETNGEYEEIVFKSKKLADLTTQFFFQKRKIPYMIIDEWEQKKPIKFHDHKEPDETAETGE